MFSFIYKPPTNSYSHVHVHRIAIPAMVIFRTPLEEKINNFCNGNIYHDEDMMYCEFNYENLINVIDFLQQRGGTLENWKEIVIMLAKKMENQNA